MKPPENRNRARARAREDAVTFVRIQLEVAEKRMDAARAAETPEGQKIALSEARTSLRLASFALRDLNQSESDVFQLVDKFKTLSQRMSYYAEMKLEP